MRDGSTEMDDTQWLHTYSIFPRGEKPENYGWILLNCRFTGYLIQSRKPCSFNPFLQAEIGDMDGLLKKTGRFCGNRNWGNRAARMFGAFRDMLISFDVYIYICVICLLYIIYYICNVYIIDIHIYIYIHMLREFTCYVYVTYDWAQWLQIQLSQYQLLGSKEISIFGEKHHHPSNKRYVG